MAALRIEVCEYSAPTTIGVWRLARAHRPAAHHPQKVLVLVAVLVLHGVLMSAWLEGLTWFDVPSDPDALAGSRGDGEPRVTTAFFVQAPTDGEETITATATDSPLMEAHSVELSPPTLNLDEALVDLGQATVESASVLEGVTEHERLRGIYVAQLEARLARMWQEESPQVSSANVEECAIRLTQDRSGLVTDIDYARCPAGENFRKLVHASIHRAAPLPAPPSPELFSDFVDLTVSSSGQRLVSAALPTRD